MTLKDAFAHGRRRLLNAVRGISDLIIAPGLINVDFADVRTIMTGMGRALMGTGYGTGDKRAVEAAQQAISSPLLEDVSIDGATGILINITGGPDLTLAEVNEACSLIAEAADHEAQHHLRLGHRRATWATRSASPSSRPASTSTRRSTRRRAQGADTDTDSARPRKPDGAADAGVLGHGAGPDHDGAAAADGSLGTDVEPDAARRLRRAGAASGRQRRGDQPRRVLLEHVGGSAGRDGRRAARHPAERARVDAVGAADRQERPMVRPQATNTAPPPVPGRRSAQMQSPRPADELGVEESEFDKPTYLRRGLYAPE